METTEACGAAGNGHWRLYLGIGLGVAASAAAVTLLAARAGCHSRADLLQQLEGLRGRLAQVAERAAGQGRQLLDDQRSALQAAIDAGRLAADQRAEELQAQLHKS